jgi:hypothetical protein
MKTIPISVTKVNTSPTKEPIKNAQTAAFMQTTTIHGFGFIQNSVSLLEIIFWCVAMLMFFVLLANDVMKIIAMYYEKPTFADVSYITCFILCAYFIDKY